MDLNKMLETQRKHEIDKMIDLAIEIRNAYQEGADAWGEYVEVIKSGKFTGGEGSKFIARIAAANAKISMLSKMAK